MGIQGPMPGGRHAAIRMPDAGQGDDQISPASLGEELDRRMAGAEPHMDAVSEGHLLRPPPSAIDADRAGILLTDVARLVETRKEHDGESEAWNVAGG